MPCYISGLSHSVIRLLKVCLKKNYLDNCKDAPARLFHPARLLDSGEYSYDSNLKRNLVVTLCYGTLDALYAR